MEELLLNEIKHLERGNCLWELFRLHKVLKKEQLKEYKKILNQCHDTDSILKALGDNTLYWLLQDAISEIVRYIMTSYSWDSLRFYFFQKRRA